jgi:chorismate-pyruvate lyase
VDTTASSRPFEHLPPVLRTLLLTDGTVTRFLEAWYGEPIRVRTLQHGEAPLESDLAPLESKKGEPVLSRLISMRGGETDRLYGIAESRLRADLLWPRVREELVQERLGIGELMRERRIETYRELLGGESVPAGPWATALECPPDAPTVARTYRIFVAGRPCLLITDRYVISRFT